MIKLGIIGAMTVEIQTLRTQMTETTICEQSGMTFYSGKLEQVDVVLVVCGVGKVNAAMCVQILHDCFHVTHIVNTGVAGSLCAELDIGDLVISTGAMYHDFDCHILNSNYPVGQVPGIQVHAFPADEKLIEYAYSTAEKIHGGHVRKGIVASGDQFVYQKSVKERIVADTGAICTEMEGAAIAHVAWRNGLPYVVIRAISDKADDSAQMDYPTFEVLAAKRCADITRELTKTLYEQQKQQA